MAKKWAEVAASPEFNALEPQQQEEARQQYWREVVAPNVPQDQLQSVQSEFDADTLPTIANPSAKPLDVEITGGQSVPAGDYAQMRQQEGAQVPVAKPAQYIDDSDFFQKAGMSQWSPKVVWAAAKDMFGGTESAAKYLAQQVGGTVGKDDRGEPTIVLRDGSAYSLNRPGIDSNDIANVAGNVAAFALPAGWATNIAKAKNIGLAGRAGIQALMAGGTDAALQAGVNGGQIDPMRTAAATAGGAGGEVLGSGLSNLLSKAAGASRTLTGQNAREANLFLTDNGITPTPELVRKLAPQMEQIMGGADPNAILGAEKFGFQYTQGQRLTDPARKFDQLSREERLRQTLQGRMPLEAAAQNNQARLGEAISDMGQQFGSKAATTPAEMVQGAASRLQQQAGDLEGRISAAYAKAGDGARMAVGADAVASLPARMREAARDFDLHPSITPSAARTLEQVQNATQSILGGIDGGNVKGVTLKALETQRRILNNNIQGAANPTDRAALTAMKREFDAWMDDAVDTALVSGDPASLQSLKEARALRAEYGRRFEGGKDSDKFIAGLLDGSKTPEELLNVALGASSVSKMGGARFINRLKVAADNDPEVLDGLRAAHFSRLTTGKNGEPLAMGQIMRNIKTTEYSNASVVHALYTKPQWNQIRFLASALDPLVAKGDFARTSGTTERLFRMLGGQFGGLAQNTPLVGEMLVKPFVAGKNALQAERAVSAPIRQPVAPQPYGASGLAGLLTTAESR